MELEIAKQKIRIFTKKLASGKCQVKFYIITGEGIPCYGYLLVEAGRSVRDVVEIIYRRIGKIGKPENYYHHSLMNIKNAVEKDPKLFLFTQ